MMIAAAVFFGCLFVVHLGSELHAEGYYKSADIIWAGIEGLIFGVCLTAAITGGLGS